MNKVKIITDSCNDLSVEQLQALGVDYLQMCLILDGKEFEAYNHPQKNANLFYNDLKKKIKKCGTACVNVQAFLDKFQQYTDKGFDIVYVGLSGGLSSTYENACNAAKEINEKNAGKEDLGQVYCANSMSGSGAVSLMLEVAVQMAKNGLSAKEIYENLHLNKIKTVAFFMPSDLQFLMRSGRISRLSASLGTMLNIVPVMSQDNVEGKLNVLHKCIGRKKALKTIENLLLEKIDPNSAQKIYICHTGVEEEAQKLMQSLKEKTENKDIEIVWMNYTMGCCCGPETLAVFALAK